MDIDERIEQLSDQIEARFEKMLLRISNLECDLDDKVRDAEYRIDEAMRKVRDLERKAERGY